MGAVQVPRVVAALAGAGVGVLWLLGLLGFGIAPAFAAPAPGGEPLAIIEARPASADRDATRRRFIAALATVNGVAVVADDREAALTGVATDADDALATAALAEARDGFGALECGRARPAAEDAVRLLAARQAAAIDETVRMRAAWTYVLLCADRDGDGAMARAAADRLRAIGAAAAVPPDIWARFPDIDAATDRDIVELTVSAPVGAAVTIDDVAVGVAPLTRFVAAGKHLVAVATGASRGAVIATVHGKPLTIEVAALDRIAAWRDVAAQVAAWQGAAPPTEVEVSELMTRIGVRFAVVLGERGAASLWVRRPQQRTARLVVDGDLGDPLAIGAGVMARVEAWTGAGPDPDQPLLTEDDELVREVSRPREPTRWWVYAVIGGALAAGAATIYALDAGDDRQIIDLTFP